MHTYFNHSKNKLGALYLLLLCTIVNVCQPAHANTTNNAPTHIQKLNKDLITEIQKWLDNELKQQYPTISTPQYTITNTLIKNKLWKNIEQSPVAQIEKAWYHKILHSIKPEKDINIPSTSQSVIDSIDVVISFSNVLQKVLFSNNIKFKLRKHIYLYLSQQNYTPQFIAVSSKDKPTIVIDAKTPSSPFTFPLHLDRKFILMIVFILSTAIILAIIFVKIRNSKSKRTEKKQDQSDEELDHLAYNYLEDKIDNRLGNIEEDTHTKEKSPLSSEFHQQISANNSIKLDNELTQQLTQPQTNPIKQEQECDQTALANQITNTQQTPLQNLKQALNNELLRCTSNYPYFLKKVYELWQQEHKTSTTEITTYLGDKIAIIYDILGQDTIRKTIPAIQLNDLPILEDRVIILSSDIEQWTSVYEDIQVDIARLEEHLNNPDPYQNPFGFVKAMPDQAIILLLKSKAQHIQCITLAQFDAARCQSLALHIASNPTEHQKMAQQIEHYSQYDGYFFQDVAGYLAYSLTQIIFKDKTTPLDSVSEQYAEEQSKAETRRALGDLQRQQNLGFGQHYYQSTAKDTSSETDNIEEKNSEKNRTLQKQNALSLHEKESINTENPQKIHLDVTADINPLDDQNLFNNHEREDVENTSYPTDNFNPLDVPNPFNNLENELIENTNYPTDNLNPLDAPNPFSNLENTPPLDEQNPPDNPENEYTFTEINKNSLANEWFDFGDGNKKA